MRRLACLLLAACTPTHAPVAPVAKTRPAPQLLVAPPHTKDLEAFIADAAPVIALQHVRVIDGTGAPGKDDQTIVIEGGRIRAVGDAKTPIPANAHVVDGTGKTVFPGLVDMHAHLFYGSFTHPPITNMTFGEQAVSFPLLYLAAGVTTARTTGSLEPYTDLSVKRRIDAGERPGPHFGLTGPYLSAHGEPFMQMFQLRDADDTRRFVEFWLDAGFTSLKAYWQLPRDLLGVAIETAHKHGVKITGHLCAVTFTEAADLGIDNLEHGIIVDSEFTDGKKPDECPDDASIESLVIDSPPVQTLIAKLVAKHVAVTSTLAVLEPATSALEPRTLALLNSETRKNVESMHAMIAKRPPSTEFAKEMAFERAFVKAGGTLLAGSDPSGYGAIVAGFGSQREIELLVDAGFTPLEALQIGSANGAKFLGVDSEIGTIAAGKRADLVLVSGNPEKDIKDIERVEVVYKDGVGYDPKKLVDSVTGTVGLN